jgi:diadenosine tetraphosphate (Ap4A) HIT family hydrolase
MPNIQPCPFCLESKLLEEDILFETPGGYLITAHNSDGNFLIIPKVHAEAPGDLPDNWWADFKLLFAKASGIAGQYNVSLNVGSQAGQTISHLHFWIIPRLAGKQSSGKGLASLITIVDTQH